MPGRRSPLERFTPDLARDLIADLRALAIVSLHEPERI
jgi:hypothetical protein